MFNHPNGHLSRRGLLGSLFVLPFAARAEDGWIPLFDGRSLDGWKASDSTRSWRVADGVIAGAGGRSHLFYTGPIHNGDFKNFEFKADVLARPGCNSGIYFHSAFQPTGFPAKGFEVQVNNTYAGEGNYQERKKTGSLYGVRDIYKKFVRDNEWFQMYISVRGNRAQVRLNDVLLVDYVQHDPPLIASHGEGRVIDHGTFALQCHDNGSQVLFKNIMVRPLADDLPNAAYDGAADSIDREILRMNAENYPVVDYHIHLKGGLTIEDALRESRRTGIQYGIAVNCGLKFPVASDGGVLDFLEKMKGQPCFVAMQGEGREWVNLVSKETIAKFDYVFTDAMTFTDDDGRRIRLWIEEEMPRITDKQRFMDMLVNRIVGILNNEPIDIHANPTFLPAQIAADYDELWTPERMGRVIEAAAKNSIAIEINNRYRIPSARFIKAAKKGGVKFAFGTNNDTKNLGRIEYGIQMVQECELASGDFFVPKRERV